MSNPKKLALWGTASVVLLVTILFATNAFSNMVGESNQTSGNTGTGVAMIVAAVLLIAAFLVTASLFFRYLALTIEGRRGLHH